MQIREATIHRLIKEAQTSGEGCVIEQVRQECLPIDGTLEALCSELPLPNDL